MSPPRPAQRVSRWLERVPLRWAVMGAIGLLLAISALFGGLDDAEIADDGPVAVEPGEEFIGPELATIVRSAELADAAPGVPWEPEEGHTYLVIDATVTNLWEVSTVTFQDLLQLPWLGEDLARAERVELADGMSGTQVNPEVPLDVAFIWEVPVGLVPEGSLVPVTIMAKSLTEDGDVSYGSYWAYPEPAAIVTVEAFR